MAAAVTKTTIACSRTVAPTTADEDDERDRKAMFVGVAEGHKSMCRSGRRWDVAAATASTARARERGDEKRVRTVEYILYVYIVSCAHLLGVVWIRGT